MIYLILTIKKSEEFVFNHYYYLKIIVLLSCLVSVHQNQMLKLQFQIPLISPTVFYLVFSIESSVLCRL